MESLLSFIGLALKALGIIDIIERAIERQRAREQGRQEQHADDLQATVNKSREAARSDDDVRGLSDADLDRRLRGDKS